MNCNKCNKTYASHTHYLIHCETELHKTGKRKKRTDIKEEFKCNICNLDNLPADRFISVSHIEKQIEFERNNLTENNK